MLLSYTSNPASLLYYSYSTLGDRTDADTISDSSANNTMTFSYFKTLSPQTESSNSTQIFQPEGVITDNQDNVYVNDIQSNEIKKI